MYVESFGHIEEANMVSQMHEKQNQVYKKEKLKRGI